ncbi:hypothetical protein [Halorubrum aethiopicum]|uniref:hypothetical protein n=1 Tax=Halorubrum aethiopicum TaxID=1758255 RepID=UPI0008326074|nr:hypothetical protein [Halorubrum aethiopicum]
MTENDPPLDEYFDPLRTEHRTSLRKRMERYREQLEDRGYEVTIAEGTTGLFAGVLVIDEERGRFGFLEEDGSVSWLDGSGGFGALGSAIVQNHTDEFERQAGAIENADVE